jgi:hypothetical protein
VTPANLDCCNHDCCGLTTVHSHNLGPEACDDCASLLSEAGRSARARAQRIADMKTNQPKEHDL